MADKPNPYRFTIRHLLIATAGLGVLLFIWRREGIYLAGALTLTLVAGVLLIRGLRRWPIKAWRAPFATCSVLSIGNVVICLLITHAYDRWTFINVSSVSPMFLERYHVEFGALNGIIALLISTALIICFIFLLKYSRWNLFAPLWILFNLAFISLLIRNYFPSFEREMGEEVSQGYFLGLVVLLLPIVVRWIQNLPTERYEIPELNSESDDSESQQVAGEKADKPSPANMDKVISMADKPNPYRFSIRDLLIAMSLFALLFGFYKLKGIQFTGAMMVTLIGGGLFLKSLAIWPIPKWKAPFFICFLLTTVMTIFFFVGINTYAYRHPYQDVWGAYEREIVASPYLLSSLASIALMVCCIQLIRQAIRPFLSKLLLTYHLLFSFLILRELTSQRDSEELIYGALFGLLVLSMPFISRWLNSLPTTREEDQEFPAETDASASQTTTDNDSTPQHLPKAD